MSDEKELGLNSHTWVWSVRILASLWKIKYAHLQVCFSPPRPRHVSTLPSHQCTQLAGTISDGLAVQSLPRRTVTVTASGSQVCVADVGVCQVSAAAPETPQPKMKAIAAMMVGVGSALVISKIIKFRDSCSDLGADTARVCLCVCARALPNTKPLIFWGDSLLSAS